MKRMYFLFVLSSAFVFTGCLDMSVDIWIRPNNAGRMTLEVSMDEYLAKAEYEKGKTFAEGLKEQLAQNVKSSFGGTTFTRANIQEYYRNGKYHAAFDAEATGLFSASELTRLGYGNYRVNWLFETNDQEIPEDQRWLFIGRYLTINLHGARILSSNGNISGDMKTTTWSYPLTEAFKKGFRRTFQADLKPLAM